MIESSQQQFNILQMTAIMTAVNLCFFIIKKLRLSLQGYSQAEISRSKLTLQSLRPNKKTAQAVLLFGRSVGYAQRKNQAFRRFAELSDVSPQLISNAENGAKAISSDKLYRISKALKASADYLLHKAQ